MISAEVKHAYLIIAHNEFDILQKLISGLDHKRNDIFVHFDKKVREIPHLHTNESKLIIMEDRIDVRWGNISQIRTELLLFETAMKYGPYAYYHLISGTHLPLKPADTILQFFDSAEGSLFSNLEQREDILKIRRINLFTKTYTSDNKALANTSQWLWRVCIAFQRSLNIKINKNLRLYWANNWCSLKDDAVRYLVSNKKAILKRYRWSLCGDEYFVPTELMDSPLKDTVINSDLLLEGSIVKANAKTFTIEDKDRLLASECMFARKFESKYQDIVDLILQNNRLQKNKKH